MRPTLPAAPSLPVAHLAAGFGDVTNAYKFYWLLAILAHAQARRGIHTSTSAEGLVVWCLKSILETRQYLDRFEPFIHLRGT